MGQSSLGSAGAGLYSIKVPGRRKEPAVCEGEKAEGQEAQGSLFKKEE